MRVVSIGSSSSGNSYIIQAGLKNLLLDVGLSATKIIGALSQCGIDPEAVDAVLLTHEHIDHVRSVRAIARKCPNADFYASRGTVAGCENIRYIPAERLEILRRGDIIEFGDVRVRCYGLSHDANEPLGYSVFADGEQLTVVTDTGIVTDEIFNEMRAADILLIEANHEENILMYGDYPYSVKMRILSDHGHLSNVTAGEILARMLEHRGDRVPDIMLAHLSEKNNTPYQARLTVESVLKEHGYVRDENYHLCIAAKEGLTEPR